MTIFSHNLHKYEKNCNNVSCNDESFSPDLVIMTYWVTIKRMCLIVFVFGECIAIVFIPDSRNEVTII